MMTHAFNFRLLAVITALSFTLMLSACGGSAEAPTEPAPTIEGAEAPPGGGDAATLPTEAPDVIEGDVDDDVEATETPDPDARPRATSLFATFDSPEERAALLTPVVFVSPEPTIEGELPVPGPGTLVASETEDPNIGRNFESLRLVRTGGPEVDGEQQTLEITIQSSGEVTRNGVQGQISQSDIDRLNLYIRDMNFFGAQGTMMGPLGPEDTQTFVYQVYVDRGDLERTINAMDGFMPAQMQQFIGEIILQTDQVR